MIRRIRLAQLALLPILAVTLASFNTSDAKTRYVEIWGSNTNPNCSRSQPCRNIQHAINQSGANDRIVVGPGEYFGNLTIFSHQSGLKLESTAGRFATIIRPGLDIDGLTIEAPRVRVGGKGKGFTFQGPEVALGALPTTEGNGIVGNVDAENLRIEGNRFQWNRRGLWIENGMRASIRNNIALMNLWTGIFCASCERSIIQDNRVEYTGGQGIYIVSASSRTSVRRNIATGNGDDGIASSSLIGQHARVQDNVTEQNDVHGFDLHLPAGNFMGNISTDNGSYGVGLSLYGNNGSGVGVGRGNVKQNLSALNGLGGFSLESPDEAKIENNFSAHNGTYGFNFFGGIFNGNPRVRNNSSIDSFCGMYNGVTDNFVFTGQYFGNHDGSETCGPDTYDTDNSCRRDTPVPVRVNRARAVAGG